MRPPQFAGESNERQQIAAGLERASMRPPQFAGESALGAARQAARDAASMRPPQFAGESNAEATRQYRMELASMRPPQFAGESRLGSCVKLHKAEGFNEAPAVRGGKSGTAQWFPTLGAALQ